LPVLLVGATYSHLFVAIFRANSITIAIAITRAAQARWPGGLWLETAPPVRWQMVAFEWEGNGNGPSLRGD
jgi:hypothetical protein